MMTHVSETVTAEMVPETVTVSPVGKTMPVGGNPFMGEIIIPAAACAPGVMTDETETNTPDKRSNNTKNEELTLTVAN